MPIDDRVLAWKAVRDLIARAITLYDSGSDLEVSMLAGAFKPDHLIAVAFSP